MSLIEKILNDRIFKSLTESASKGEREEIEKSIREMLAPAEEFYYKILDAGSTEEGVENLSEAIIPIIAPMDEDDVEK